MRHWTCLRCGYHNNRIGGRTRCANPDGCDGRAPAVRLPAHRRANEALSYADALELSRAIHPDMPAGKCGLCGGSSPSGRKLDRDHEKARSRFRGLACAFCNRHVIGQTTLGQARALVAYLERVERYYGRQAA